MLSGSLFCAEHFSDLPLYLGYSAGNNSFTHKEFIQHKYLPQETNQQITFCFSFLRNAASNQESEQVYLWLQILNYNPPAGRKSKGTVSIVICPECIYINPGQTLQVDLWCHHQAEESDPLSKRLYFEANLFGGRNRQKHKVKDRSAFFFYIILQRNSDNVTVFEESFLSRRVNNVNSCSHGLHNRYDQLKAFVQ